MHRLCAFLILAASCIGGVAHAQTSVVLDDFSGGVTAKKQAGGGGDFVTWYDSCNKASGNPAATLAPAGAMKISGEDVINGVYRVFAAPVPSTGQWHVNCKVHVVEASPFNTINNFQVGVIVNGVHRGTGNTKLAKAAIVASTHPAYLTSADDTAKGIQNLRTPDFEAQAGDNILITLGTDVTSGNFNLNSGAWGDSYVLIDDIVLETIGLPVNISSFSLE